MVAHDLERPPPARPAERVRRVGERVEVQRSRQERGRADREGSRREGRQAGDERVGEQPGEEAEHAADDREERCAARDVPGVERHRPPDRHPGQERDRRQRGPAGAGAHPPVPETPASSNVAISTRIARAAPRSGSASAAPLPSPSRSSSSSSGLEPELREHERVPGLGRAVRRDEVAAQRRREPHRDERRDGRDVPVDEHDGAAARGAERDAREHRELEAADGGEHPERVARVRPAGREHPPDDRHLARETCVVEARPAAAGGLRRAAEQGAGERRRDRRVPDAHLAERDGPCPLGDEPPPERVATDDPLGRDGALHRRLVDRVPGSRPEREVEDAFHRRAARRRRRRRRRAARPRPGTGPPPRRRPWRRRRASAP